jgi:hypothetical protein
VEPDRKPEPETVSVNAAPPALTKAGESPLKAGTELTGELRVRVSVPEVLEPNCCEPWYTAETERVPGAEGATPVQRAMPELFSATVC